MDSFDNLKKQFILLNEDKSTHRSTNDEPTPLECVSHMISHIPHDLWKQNITILDPCCGNGNFFVPIYFELLKYHDEQTILKKMFYFNDINEDRLNNVRKVFGNTTNITNIDFMKFQTHTKYDLIVANPPYAKLLEDGTRASKNHNLIKDFVEKALKLLKPNGYLLFITPDNWMSYADRNTLIKTITKLQIIHLDIHTAKRYFKKIGSSFTWYIVQNTPFYKNITVSGIWKKEEYTSSVISQQRNYIPLFYNETVHSILSKTIDTDLKKFDVKTSSNLHRYTKAKLISNIQTDTHVYRLIHTPKQTVYSSQPHIYQDEYKVFISTTDKYKVFVDNCGMTQSICFILCKNKEQAETYKTILEHPLYVFLNNICRWGNFNNIRILQSFPIPQNDNIYSSFGITNDEIYFIEKYN